MGVAAALPQTGASDCRRLDRFGPRRRPGLSFGFLLALQLGVAPAHAGVRPSRTGAAHRCRTDVRLLTRGYGSPDDVAVSGSRIFFDDIRAGFLVEVNGTRRRVLSRDFNVPEGIALLNRDTLAVVEQGHNRIDVVNLRNLHRRVLITLRNGTGRAGVDGISVSGGHIVIPDSPYGRVYRVQAGRLQLVAGGLSRPTDAVAYGGGLAVADENANAIWSLRSGRIRRLATLSTPDDIAVVHGMLLAVTLGDGGLWEVRPRLRRLAGFRSPQGLAVLSSRAVLVADSTQNALFRVSISGACFR